MPEKLQETRRAWSRLAASISEELIRIGVRAVVAAGWAVDDQAARLFATEFYNEMLSGIGSGDMGMPFNTCGERTYNDKRVGAIFEQHLGRLPVLRRPGVHLRRSGGQNVLSSAGPGRGTRGAA